MEATEQKEERKFKDVEDFHILTEVSNRLIWVREVLSLLDKGYEAEDDGNDREGSVKPIFLVGEALDKLVEAEKLNEELWDRYKAVKETTKEAIKKVLDSPKFKKLSLKNLER